MELMISRLHHSLQAGDHDVESLLDVLAKGPKALASVDESLRGRYRRHITLKKRWTCEENTGDSPQCDLR